MFTILLRSYLTKKRLKKSCDQSISFRNLKRSICHLRTFAKNTGSIARMIISQVLSSSINSVTWLMRIATGLVMKKILSRYLQQRRLFRKRSSLFCLSRSLSQGNASTVEKSWHGIIHMACAADVTPAGFPEGHLMTGRKILSGISVFSQKQAISKKCYI